MKLTIRQGKANINSLTPGFRGAVWLDDLLISNRLISLELALDAKEVTYTTLRLALDEVEVDAETVLALQAHLEGQPDEADGEA